MSDRWLVNVGDDANFDVDVKWFGSDGKILRLYGLCFVGFALDDAGLKLNLFLLLFVDVL